MCTLSRACACVCVPTRVWLPGAATGELSYNASQPGPLRLAALDLLGSTLYSVAVVAVNAVGSSAPSVSASFVTLSPVPPAPPGQPALMVCTAGTATMRLQRPADLGGSALLGYRAGCSTDGQAYSQFPVVLVSWATKITPA